MFNIGIPELLVIFVVAILVIGPKKLPEVANALGKGLAEFKRALNDVKEELKIDEVRNDVNEMKDSLLFKNSLFDEEKKEPEEKKEIKSEAVETPDKADKKEATAPEDHSQTPPSPKSDPGK